jgi:hypothetical protein
MSYLRSPLGAHLAFDAGNTRRIGSAVLGMKLEGTSYDEIRSPSLPRRLIQVMNGRIKTMNSGKV